MTYVAPPRITKRRLGFRGFNELLIPAGCYLYIQVESSALALFPLCGLSSISTLFFLVSTAMVIAPRHQKRLYGIFGRLTLTTNLTCFYSASIASLLAPDWWYTAESKGIHNQGRLLFLFDILPGYKDLMQIAGF
jgi:hypothetical protein